MNKSTVLDNSRQCVGKIRWTQKATGKYLLIHRKNYRIIYVYLPRYRVSQRLFDVKFAETLNSVASVFEFRINQPLFSVAFLTAYIFSNYGGASIGV